MSKLKKYFKEKKKNSEEAIETSPSNDNKEETSTTAKVENISIKHNSIKIDGNWYTLAEDLDITELIRDAEYTFKIDEHGFIINFTPIKILETPEIEKVIVEKDTTKKNTAESPDVWAMKDWRITKLAAIERAIQYLNSEKSVKQGNSFDLNDVLEVSDIFVEYAYKGSPPV